MNCLKYYKRCVHNSCDTFDVSSTEEDQIHNGTILYVAYPIVTIPCPLMLRGLKESDHLQAWHWHPKPEYAVSSIRTVNSPVFIASPAKSHSNIWQCDTYTPPFRFLWFEASQIVQYDPYTYVQEIYFSSATVMKTKNNETRVTTFERQGFSSHQPLSIWSTF